MLLFKLLYPLGLDDHIHPVNEERILIEESSRLREAVQMFTHVYQADKLTSYSSVFSVRRSPAGFAGSGVEDEAVDLGSEFGS